MSKQELVAKVESTVAWDPKTVARRDMAVKVDSKRAVEVAVSLSATRAVVAAQAAIVAGVIVAATAVKTVVL